MKHGNHTVGSRYAVGVWQAATAIHSGCANLAPTRPPSSPAPATKASAGRASPRGVVHGWGVVWTAPVLQTRASLGRAPASTALASDSAANGSPLQEQPEGHSGSFS
jgi:hypothetical protein